MSPTRTQPRRSYRRAASPPVTASSTNNVLPHSRRVREQRRAVEVHGQAIPLAQPVALLAPGDVDRALEHPDLLVHAPIAAAGLEGHAPAGRELHLDDPERLGHARRRDVAAEV